MNEYLVKTENDYTTVYADDIAWDANELIFFKNRIEIAVFINWDYWIESTAKKKEHSSENQHS